jgi:hypothetical protein
MCETGFHVVSDEWIAFLHYSHELPEYHIFFLFFLGDRYVEQFTGRNQGRMIIPV